MQYCVQFVFVNEFCVLYCTVYYTYYKFPVYWRCSPVQCCVQFGDSCMVLPTVPMEEAQRMFPAMEVKKVPSGKTYMRYTPQPQ